LLHLRPYPECIESAATRHFKNAGSFGIFASSSHASDADFDQEAAMLSRRKALVRAAGLAGMVSLASAGAGAAVGKDGIVSIRSAYGFQETLDRLKADIAAKKIMFFDAIDQAKLAADAGIGLRPSTLLIFGNPPLGAQFLTANPAAGLDWPVRLLVTEDARGQVWASYSDFHWIARRHGISTRDKAFDMAAQVIASIASSVAAK
jgi:uncharacterized protein (DUF302 family)